MHPQLLGRREPVADFGAGHERDLIRGGQLGEPHRSFLKAKLQQHVLEITKPDIRSSERIVWTHRVELDREGDMLRDLPLDPKLYLPKEECRDVRLARDVLPPHLKEDLEARWGFAVLAGRERQA